MNKEDLNKEIGSTMLEKSGAYKVNVTGVYKRIGQNGVSTGLVFLCEEEGTGLKGEFTVWFIDSKGQLMYTTAMLTQMVKISGVRCLPADFTITKGLDRFKNDVDFINELANIKLGVFLEHNYNDKGYVQFECKGFYYPQTGKTSSETANGITECKKLNYWKEKFEERNRVVTKEMKPTTSKQDKKYDQGADDSTEEFPF